MATSTRVPLRTKLAYGFGAVAYGIKDNGFSVFLLIFYNQVVGLPAEQVGLVVLLALVIDAFVDPAIGSLSDRTHTRWGRRHPWLYASALPIALSWLMLWSPPATTGAAALGYLLIVAILARAMIATNEVPSLAMAPEITRDYHERTAVLRYRYVFGWAGGLVMLVLAYIVILAPPYGAQAGPLAPASYRNYGLIGAIVMMASVLVSAIGTHRLLAHPPARRIERETFRQTLAGIRRAFSNPAFLVLIAAGTFAYVNQGVSFATSNYMLNYVWRLDPAEFLPYSLSLFAGVVAAFFGVTPIARLLGKHRAAAVLALISAGFATLPYWLRLADLFPPVGSPNLLPLYFLCVGAATATGVAVMILGGSMMADVVEASEERTGRREEGLFYAGALFMQKCTSGLGIFVSGAILAIAGFPARAVPGAVDEAVLDRMTGLFAALTVVFAILAALIFLRFPFGREEHEARLAKLAVAAAAPPGE